MPIPEIRDVGLVNKAIEKALARFPGFAPFGPRLVGRPIYQGVAYQLTWQVNPPAELTGAWAFQNAAVKAYQRLAAG
jgi:hypothetical protein